MVGEGHVAQKRPGYTLPWALGYLSPAVLLQAELKALIGEGWELYADPASGGASVFLPEEPEDLFHPPFLSMNTLP